LDSRNVIQPRKAAAKQGHRVTPQLGANRPGTMRAPSSMHASLRSHNRSSATRVPPRQLRSQSFRGTTRQQHFATSITSREAMSRSIDDDHSIALSAVSDKMSKAHSVGSLPMHEVIEHVVLEDSLDKLGPDGRYTTRWFILTSRRIIYLAAPLSNPDRRPSPWERCEECDLIHVGQCSGWHLAQGPRLPFRGSEARRPHRTPHHHIPSNTPPIRTLPHLFLSAPHHILCTILTSHRMVYQRNTPSPYGLSK